MLTDPLSLNERLEETLRASQYVNPKGFSALRYLVILITQWAIQSTRTDLTVRLTQKEQKVFGKTFVDLGFKLWNVNPISFNSTYILRRTFNDKLVLRENPVQM